MVKKTTKTGKRTTQIEAVHTIGVYGTSEQSFFDSLVSNKVDTFCDIRRRRGLRGSKYKYANSAYLQAKLEELGIRYLYLQDWSPTDEIRAIQKAADKKAGVTQTTRMVVCEEFIRAYRALFLKSYDPKEFLAQVGPARIIALFCVEQAASACHRVIAAEELRRRLNAGGEDITIAGGNSGEDRLE